MVIQGNVLMSVAAENVTNGTVRIPDGVMRIGNWAFRYCSGLTSITISSSVTSIGAWAFYGCSGLRKPDKYKALNVDLTCRDFQYEFGKWYEEPEANLCNCGFHFCESAFDLFNYYNGKLGKDIRIFEVDVDEVSAEVKDDSKRACKKIRLTKEIKSYAELLN